MKLLFRSFLFVLCLIPAAFAQENSTASADQTSAVAEYIDDDRPVLPAAVAAQEGSVPPVTETVAAEEPQDTLPQTAAVPAEEIASVQVKKGTDNTADNGKKTFHKNDWKIVIYVLCCFAMFYLISVVRTVLASGKEYPHQEKEENFSRRKNTPRPVSRRAPVRTVELEEITDDLPNMLVENVAPDNTYEITNALQSVYPSFNATQFLERVKTLFLAVQNSLATGDLSRIKTVITPALYEQYQRKLKDYERLNQRYILQSAFADRAYFFAYRRNRSSEILSVVVDVRVTEYAESTITGMIVKGKKDAELDLQYFYIFKNTLMPDGKRKWLLSDDGLLNVSLDYGPGGVFIER